MNRYRDTARSRVAPARERAAVEMIARHESALRRTARRFSLDAGDAEDAYQRALEILLTKAPTTDPRELIRWTQTVIKHEALAVRRSRERLLGPPPPEWREGAGSDPLASLPSRLEGPDEQVERREDVARTREALRTLKPAELRALSLLAEGYSYAEISELTGYSHTKVNRVLAEGRSRFRALIASSEDGRRCQELRPLLSAFCDEEASLEDAETMREHLRACAHCRATMRAYRAAPGLASVLIPSLAPSRSPFDLLHDILARLGSQISGTAKLVTACAASTAACVATGVLPIPFADQAPGSPPAIERSEEQPGEPSGQTRLQQRKRREKPDARRRTDHHPSAPESSSSVIEAEAPPEPIEYTSPAPAPPAEAAPSPGGSTESSGSAAGEFGP